MKPSLIRIAAILVGLGAVISCGGDSTAPPSVLVGSYSAIEFTTTGSSGQTNQLLAGSTLNITLAADHTTSGHLHVVASGSTPAFDADLAGTWAQTGSSVTFSQPTDSFVRNMTFAVVAASNSLWELDGDGTFAGTAVHVTLRQQPTL
jgi:hypothetical protein